MCGVFPCSEGSATHRRVVFCMGKAAAMTGSSCKLPPRAIRAIVWQRHPMSPPHKQRQAAVLGSLFALVLCCCAEVSGVSVQDGLAVLGGLQMFSASLSRFLQGTSTGWSPVTRWCVAVLVSEWPAHLSKQHHGHTLLPAAANHTIKKQRHLQSPSEEITDPDCYHPQQETTHQPRYFP
ncbi:hypothetical protein CCHOA_11195 [Corynebacterium choanae]|uniref:Uncharacterized protein n=1 Tax=Corynebacterium choanae TaxID=1862358 RepID=A0A3G6J915_9CORY|nr:hypothetical protein CCHOA_11195 [Corynebacterium choanae]